MRSIRSIGNCVSLAILAISLWGCGVSRSIEPRGYGYEIITYTRTSISEPSANQITLQYYKPGEGRKMIWPSIRSRVITNNFAVFVADRATEMEDADDPEATISRVFAVRGVAQPVDITDEVLLKRLQSSKWDIGQASKAASIAYLTQTNNLVEFHFSVSFPPRHFDVDILMSIDQVSDIMRDVQEKGVAKKDPVWGTWYIEGSQR